jgi:hypothetical protein
MRLPPTRKVIALCPRALMGLEGLLSTGLLAAPDLDELRNDIRNRLGRVDLMRARGT